MPNSTTTDTFRSRAIARVWSGQPTSDGAGVNLVRVFDPRRYADLDPFLLLDEFRSDDAADYMAGFPNHPHRGFETVTYMLAGAMRHEDSVGNTGRLRAGSVQWMTAGRGIIHSEMPEQEEGLMHGFQLWVNLPAEQKMGEPRYQDIDPADIPEVTSSDGATVKIITGSFEGTNGPVQQVATTPLYLDITVPAVSCVTIPIPASHNGFVYGFEGAADFGLCDNTTVIDAHQIGVLGSGDESDGLQITTHEQAVRFLLLAAQPIGEPVAHWGPFVMNTQQELKQAFADYDAGRLA
jgi:redox-sensitive bicupin YhaK (pirin superfamily)